MDWVVSVVLGISILFTASVLMKFCIEYVQRNLGWFENTVERVLFVTWVIIAIIGGALLILFAVGFMHHFLFGEM